MGHLTEDCFEDILWGGGAIPEHVDWCVRCRARLQEKYALAHLMRRTFSSVHADPGLAGRILAQLAAVRSRTAVTTG